MTAPDITWGPYIRVDGKRPEWLGDDVPVRFCCYGEQPKGSGTPARFFLFNGAGTYHLPSDNPHYATQTPAEQQKLVGGYGDPYMARKEAHEWRSDIVLSEDEINKLLGEGQMRQTLSEGAPGASAAVVARKMTTDEVREMLKYDEDTIVATMQNWGFALLPEPVDADVTLAKEMFDAAYPDNPAWETPQVREGWVRAAKVVRGRALAAGERHSG